MKSERLHWPRPIAATLALLLLAIGSSMVLIHWINQEEEAYCFEQLSGGAQELAHTIEERAANDTEELELLAAIAGGYEDLSSPELWGVLKSVPQVGLLSRLEILLRGDVLLTADGRRLDVSGQLSFEEAAARGTHITDRVTDVAGSGGYILRNYVPIRRDGQITGMLCGVVELNTLPQELENSWIMQGAALYIIDGATGDFLMDTWHEDVGGNIWALGERPMAPGYDHQQLQEGLKTGESNYVVFVSRTVGEYLYFYYTPMTINQWRVALSVPETTVFARADTLRTGLNLFLVFEALCFVAYLLWMLWYVRGETREKQRQLDVVRLLYDVEKLLFNAHESKENVLAALEKTAGIVMAETAGFWMVGLPWEEASYRWEGRPVSSPKEENDRRKVIFRLMDRFQSGEEIFEAYTQEKLRQVLPRGSFVWVRNMVALPVEDAGGDLRGVLVVSNIRKKKQDIDLALLKNAGFSFSLFQRNIQSYSAMREYGERDALSGLYNRNRFQTDLSLYGKRSQGSLACVYVDMNGLHERNNTQGHEAGDKMIQATARLLRQTFGGGCSYRIGGDEFLAFASDITEEEVAAMTRSMEEALAREGIHISAGVQWAEEPVPVETLVKQAERKMYQAKRAYYSAAGHDRRGTGARE